MFVACLLSSTNLKTKEANNKKWFVRVHQHGGGDVTCKPRIILTHGALLISTCSFREPLFPTFSQYQHRGRAFLCYKKREIGREMNKQIKKVSLAVPCFFLGKSVKCSLTFNTITFPIKSGSMKRRII